MSVEFKSPVTSANVNQAFLDKNKDTETLFKVALKRAGSGASVLDIQQAINDLISQIALHIADYSAHREFDTKANLDTWATTANNGDFAFATDEKKSYQVIDGVLAEIGGGGGGLNQWESAASYVIGDVIWLLADYKIYVCIADNSDVTFTPANWQELSSNFLESYVSVTPNDNISITDSLGTNLFRKDFNELYIEDFKENLPSVVLTASNVAITVNDATNASYLSNTISTFAQSGASTTQYVETAPIAITNSNKWLLEPIKIQAMQGISGGAGTWDFRVFTSTDGVSYTDKNVVVQLGNLKNDKIITQLADDTTHVKLRWTIVNPDNATTLTLGGFTITSDAFPVGQTMITDSSYAHNFTRDGVTGYLKYTTFEEDTNRGAIKVDNSGLYTKWVALKDIPAFNLSTGFVGTGTTVINLYILNANGTIKKRIIDYMTAAAGEESVSFSTSMLSGECAVVYLGTAITDSASHTVSTNAIAYADNVIVDAATFSTTQTKVLASNTLNAQMFEFDVEEGVEYEISGQISRATSNSQFASVMFSSLPTGGGEIFGYHYMNSGTGTWSYNKVDAVSLKFKGTSSKKLYVHAFGNNNVLGNNTKENTYIQVSKVPPAFVQLDVSNDRENEYTAIIDTSGNIEYQSPTFLTSASGTTGTGRRTLVWPDGFFGSNANAISVSATILDNDGNVSSITASNITTTGCRIFTEISNAAAFRRFSVTVKALGAAYKAPKAFLANAVSVYPTAYLKDVKPSGTIGGTFTSGAWQTRTLNTIEGDGFVTLSSNQFTLPSGKYEIEAYAPAFNVNQHKAKIRNITDGTDSIIGKSMFVDISSGAGGLGFTASDSIVAGIIEISSAKTFELQHRCTTTRANDGFGVASNFGVNEIFSQVKIKKIL